MSQPSSESPAASCPRYAEQPPFGLPVPARLHRWLQGRIRRLPVKPPSHLAAMALNQHLLPRLPAGALDALTERCVELWVSDLGLCVRLTLAPRTQRFVAGDRSSHGKPDLRVTATCAGYLQLLRGQDDPDRLFFDRILSLEGDTELGLMIKNTLDAIGPLWPPTSTPKPA